MALCSCAGIKKDATNNIKQTEKELLQLQDEKVLMKAGVTFSAEGNTPINWSIKMNYDEKVNFIADDGLQVNTAFNSLKKTMQNDTTIFKGKVTAGEIIITTHDGSCTVPALKKVFSKLVTVNINGKLYSGCGNFLYDANLTGKWNLEKIGNLQIIPAEYNKIPFFEFDMIKQTLVGNDGCNRINGHLEVQGKRIQFATIKTTQMNCRKKNISTIIATLISDKLVDYYFKNNRLYLYLPDDSLLVFIKAAE